MSRSSVVQRMSSFVSFFVRSESPFLRPDPQQGQDRRAQGAVKVGRRTTLSTCFALARPYLDSFEHDGTAGGGRDDDRRGSPLSGADQSRHNLVFGRSEDPNHDAVMRIGSEAPSGGPILPFGLKPRDLSGFRHLEPLSASVTSGQGRIGVPSASSVHCTARKTTPSGTMPSRTSRHRAISSLRAKATIMGFRVPRAFSVRDRNHCVKALVFWCRRNRHAN